MEVNSMYKIEVKTGTDPKWYSNAMRYPTLKEAEDAAWNLAMRWTAVVDYRAVVADEVAK
jgi:hypothetical protein